MHVISHHQTTRQNHNIGEANKSTKNVPKFKYLGTVTNQNCIHKEIKSPLNLENAHYRVATFCLPICHLKT
jgi:hypothetical protein